MYSLNKSKISNVEQQTTILENSNYSSAHYIFYRACLKSIKSSCYCIKMSMYYVYVPFIFLFVLKMICEHQSSTFCISMLSNQSSPQERKLSRIKSLRRIKLSIIRYLHNLINIYWLV